MVEILDKRLSYPHEYFENKYSVSKFQLSMSKNDLTFKVTVEAVEGTDGDGFDLTAFGTAAPWWKGVAADGTASADANGGDVVRVEGSVHLKAVGQIGLYQVSLKFSVFEILNRKFIHRCQLDLILLTF